ncbi:MAG: energy transducer TonB, partial [Bacteroidia bacterium]|nr:energy transducer TonB [Bacteroidia bacterium]
MGDIAFTGQTSLLLVFILALLVIGVIFYFKTYFKRKSSQDLAELYKDHEWSSPLEARNKYPDVNGFRFSRPIFLFGMATALAATLFAFSWTSYDSKIVIPEGALEWDEEIEIEPPRTAEPPPPPPPPPPPVIEEVPEEEIEEEDEPVFVDQDVTEEDVVEEV